MKNIKFYSHSNVAVIVSTSFGTNEVRVIALLMFMKKLLEGIGF